MQKENFTCCNCGRSASFLKLIGTKHRNHCPFCLWSKHVDLEESGDRKAKCKGKMKPIGLTFKREGKDKYGLPRQGELMLIHECLNCGKVSINRIAGDDDGKTILKIFEESQKMSVKKRKQLENNKIKLLSGEDRKNILGQLFGKRSL